MLHRAPMCMYVCWDVCKGIKLWTNSVCCAGKRKDIYTKTNANYEQQQKHLQWQKARGTRATARQPQSTCCTWVSKSLRLEILDRTDNLKSCIPLPLQEKLPIVVIFILLQKYIAIKSDLLQWFLNHCSVFILKVIIFLIFIIVAKYMIFAAILIAAYVKTCCNA